MNPRSHLVTAAEQAVPVLAIMIGWIVVTAIVYGGFLVFWPVDTGASAWVYAGVFAFPFVGYLAHLAAWVRTA